MMARPVVDLPQPDSPTRPSVSPGSTSRLMPDTALTFSPVWPTGNSTTRSSTRSSGSPGARRCALPDAGHHMPAGDRRGVGGRRPPTAVRRSSRYSGEPTGYQQAYSWPGSSASTKRRLLVVAPLAGVGAAGRELAPLRRVDQVGRPARR